MELRKAQEMGGGTLLISLPKGWVKRSGLKKGSLLTVEVGSDGGLMIHPFTSGEKKVHEIQIPYPAEYVEHLLNRVTAAYLLGYDMIRVQGRSRITYGDREQIKKLLGKLVGLEIVEEDASSITLQFLLEPTTLDPQKIFRRMHMIVLGMHRDAITSFIERDEHLPKVVVERDDEADRLYFLLVRLIRTAILDPRLAGGFGLSPIDCLDYRVASNLLEAIGDASVDLVKSLPLFPIEDMDEDFRKILKAIGMLLEGMQESAVKALLHRSSTDARNVAKLYSELKASLEALETRFSQRPAPALLPMLAALDKISKCHIDITDLAVTLYPMVR